MVRWTYLLIVSKSKKVSPTVKTVVRHLAMRTLAGGPGDPSSASFMSCATSVFCVSLKTSVLATDGRVPCSRRSHSCTKTARLDSGRADRDVSFRSRPWRVIVVDDRSAEVQSRVTEL